MSCQSCWIFLTSLIAFGLSIYSVYVEFQVEKAHEDDEDYEALCDINEQMSCTKVFSSKYGKAFGLDFLPEELRVPNGIYGAVLYFILALLSFSKNSKLIRIQLFLSCQTIFVSVYLAYILFFVLKDICVVCISMYVLNIINFILIQKKLNRLLLVQKDDVPIAEEKVEKEKEN